MSFDIDIACQLGDHYISAQFSSGPGITALFGLSGAGKTSILNMVAGLLVPDGGHISVAGVPLFDSAHKICLPPEKRRAGYVFQDARLFPHLRVRANLRYGSKGWEPAQSAIKIEEMADFLGIYHLLDRWPRHLSGGEAQRVAIGRALLSVPRFLLLDEPLASLDAARREGVISIIERIRDDMKIPILYVSHDRAEVERIAASIVEVG